MLQHNGNMETKTCILFSVRWNFLHSPKWRLTHDHGVEIKKIASLEAVNKSFGLIESDPKFCIAASLDPRYKENKENLL